MTPLMVGVSVLYLVVTVGGMGVRQAATPEAEPALAAADAHAVRADEFSYPEMPSQVEAGQVVLELENVGQVEHDLSFEGGDDVVVVHAEPGETARGAIDLEPGTHTYYCSIPGHREAGMEGTLEVAP